jgi:hypothetical protein
MAAIECKLAMCISRLVKFELLLELKVEQKHGTSLHTSCYKDAPPSVRGQSVCPSQLYWENIEHSYTRNLPIATVQEGSVSRLNHGQTERISQSCIIHRKNNSPVIQSVNFNTTGIFIRK